MNAWQYALLVVDQLHHGLLCWPYFFPTYLVGKKYVMNALPMATLRVHFPYCPT